MGGLSWETNEETMRTYFEKYGAITDCVIMRDRHTGHPRGFGFVTYADDSVAAKVASQRHDLDGRQVEAKRAVPRNECAQPTFTPKASMFPRYSSDGGSGSNYPTSGGDGGGAGYGGLTGAGYGRAGSSAGYGAVPTAVVSGVRGGAMHDRGGGGGSGGRHGSPSTSTHVGGSRKIFVGGLPSACHNEEFRAYFSRFGTIVEAQVMFDHQTGNSRGFGFVTYADEAGVSAAVGVGRMHEIMDKNVEVKRAETKSAAERRTASRGGPGGGGGGGGGMGGGGSSGAGQPSRDNGYGVAGRDIYGSGGRGDGYGAGLGVAGYGGAVMSGAPGGAYPTGAYGAPGPYGGGGGGGGGYGMTPEQYYYQAQAAAAVQNPQSQQVMTPAQMASWQQYYAALGYQYSPGYAQGPSGAPSPTGSSGGQPQAYDPYYSPHCPCHLRRCRCRRPCTGGAWRRRGGRRPCRIHRRPRRGGRSGGGGRPPCVWGGCRRRGGGRRGRRGQPGGGGGWYQWQWGAPTASRRALPPVRPLRCGWWGGGL